MSGSDLRLLSMAQQPARRHRTGLPHGERKVEVVTAVNFFETKLGGNDTLEIEIALPEGQDLSKIPVHLQTIAELFQERLEKIPWTG